MAPTPPQRQAFRVGFELVPCAGRLARNAQSSVARA